jgi:hypothetical protein
MLVRVFITKTKPHYEKVHILVFSLVKIMHNKPSIIILTD